MQKEFIKNALNDSLTKDIAIPAAIDEYDTFVKQKRSQDMEVEPNEGEKSDDKVPPTVTPIPTRQVLSLRGTGGSKPTPSGSNTNGLVTETLNDSERLQTTALHTVAALFYKLITTFKHS